jgi:phosphinothricin acetyltransferase
MIDDTPMDAGMGGLVARRIQVDGEITIRPAVAADPPRLTEIYNHYAVHTAITFDTEAFTVEGRAEWFSHYATSGRHRLLVAEGDGTVLGYTSSSPFSPRAAYDTTVETTILCAPEAIGLGLGKRLYAALFDALRDQDVHLVIAKITLPNDGSCRIHEHFGFECKMVLPEVGRKFGRWWDVAWYVRPFP